ncbi:MAG TPA: hypothetical protein VK513_16915 [Terriglobales bacterium]|nr:hypothetical protein [Terriglobales bacterium]
MLTDRQKFLQTLVHLRVVFLTDFPILYSSLKSAIAFRDRFEFLFNCFGQFETVGDGKKACCLFIVAP